MNITIIGWHIHPEAGVCQDCGKPAHYSCVYEGDWNYFDLCADCASGDRYTIVSDQIDDVFRRLGM